MPASFVTLIVILIAVAMLTVAAAIVLMAVILLRPARLTDGKAVWVLRRLSPGDFGLSFENINFIVRDEHTGDKLKIAGWWIPHPRANGRCVVLLHSYGDAKVGSIAWAPVWHELGFNILAIDLRAHGESTGTFSTAGFSERKDVSQVITDLRAGKPDDTRELILFGVGLGATVAAATASLRDDVAGVILDSPFDDFRDAAKVYLDGMGAPGKMLKSAALRLAERLAAARFDEMRLTQLLPLVRCPLFIITPEDDVMVPPRAREAIAAAMGARADSLDMVWVVPECKHLLALVTHREEYAQRLAAFVNAANGRRAVPAQQSYSQR